MSLYKDASLVMIPTAYKDGKLYSIRPTDGSGDFTFSRGSNLAATRVDVNGLIEKGRENVLLQSNQFDTTWTNYLSNETSGQSGYDGSNDAWLLTKTGASGHIVQAVSSSGVNTFSVYVKAGTLNWVRIIYIGGGNRERYFDLQNGTLGGSSYTNEIDSKIESIGNGWYRCSITTNISFTQARIYPAQGDFDTSGTSGNIYIQDTQLEQGLVATDYIETGASTAQAGILEDLPRLDYSGGASCPALLLEPQRTNLIDYSEYYDTWLKAGTTPTFTENYGTSPEGVQNSTRVQLDNNELFYRTPNAAQGAYVFSVFAKDISGGGSKITLRIDAPTTKVATFDLSDGSIDTYTSDNALIEDYGNGWYRCMLVQNNNAIVNAVIAEGDNDLDCEIYGAQLEAGSYPTSYIPTYGSAVTRSEDECIDAGDNSVIDSTQGTIYGEQKSLESNFTYNYFVAVSDGTNNNRLEIRQSGTGIQFLWRVGGTYQDSITLSSAPFSSTIKYALRYSSADIKFYVNGSLVGTINSPTLYPSGTLNNFQFADGSGGTNFRGVVNQALYFPTALTDSECIALTS